MFISRKRLTEFVDQEVHNAMGREQRAREYKERFDELRTRLHGLHAKLGKPFDLSFWPYPSNWSVPKDIDEMAKIAFQRIEEEIYQAELELKEKRFYIDYAADMKAKMKEATESLQSADNRRRVLFAPLEAKAHDIDSLTKEAIETFNSAAKHLVLLLSTSISRRVAKDPFKEDGKKEHIIRNVLAENSRLREEVVILENIVEQLLAPVVDQILPAAMYTTERLEEFKKKLAENEAKRDAEAAEKPVGETCPPLRPAEGETIFMTGRSVGKSRATPESTALMNEVLQKEWEKPDGPASEEATDPDGEEPIAEEPQQEEEKSDE